MEISGNILNKTAVIIDDMIDSGGTIIEASKLLKSNGAKDVFVYSTHGVLSGNAIEKLTNASEISGITITNSLNQCKNVGEKIKILKLDN
jgi:ribose-phosphate pyrophosphokinase